jgi:ABC-type multidrug transport system ATPase subunit/peptidoglycan/LPS O-acetylase OafA/YrhL
MNTQERLHALDAVRAFALLLGILFHAGFSFIPGMIPGVWAIADSSPSTAISVVLFTSHVFRMSLFFFIAGFFARMMFHRKGPRGFWGDRAKRILVPLVVGWMVLFPAIAVVWVWGLRKTFGNDMPAPPAELMSRPGAFPLTHLWFLYYLLVLYAIVMLVRRVIVAVDGAARFRRSIDRAVRGLAQSGSTAVVLALPVSAALYFRTNWFSWFGIPTPDQSVIPEVTSLIAYGTAVAFGWLVQRQTDLLQAWQRQWRGHLAAAIVATGICLYIAGPAPTLVPAARGAQTLVYATAYALAIWCWVFAVVGIAQRFLNTESAVRRYVADSSYWLYLVHLPVVVAFQVLVGHLPWHWSVKLPLILAASFAVLFGSYHALVRFSFIGGVLNGRRHSRKSNPPASSGGGPNPDAPDPTAPAPPPDCLARLRNVHKRYGKTVALGGIDLEVRRGELVALLGPNGAGKTTANSIMLGLLQPDEGEVSLLGGSPLDVERRRGVGVMLQEVTLPATLRVREHLELAAAYYPNPLGASEAMAVTSTSALAGRNYGALSAGQKRQAQLALAICGRPTLLFLDEPTVGLDVQAREAMWAAMRALVAGGSSIVLTTHYLEEVEALADRVVVLARGRVIASGTVDEIRSVVSRKRITCSSRLALDEVRGWPHVVEATADARRMQITATDAEAVVRRLLAADGSVRDLEVRQAGLTEAFAELTKEAA